MKPLAAALTRIRGWILSDRAGYVFAVIMILLFIWLAMHTPWY